MELGYKSLYTFRVPKDVLIELHYNCLCFLCFLGHTLGCLPGFSCSYANTFTDLTNKKLKGGPLLGWRWHLTRRTYPHDNQHRPIFQPAATAPTDRIFKIPSVMLS